MIDRVDLYISVVGVVASVVGSSAALWMALSKKSDKEDVARLEARMDTKLDAVETRLGARIDTVETRLGARIDAVDARVDGTENRLGATLTRVETKLDALILRLVPEQPHPRELGAGGS